MRLSFKAAVRRSMSRCVSQASKPMREDSYCAVPSANQSGCKVNGIIVRKSVLVRSL